MVKRLERKINTRILLPMKLFMGQEKSGGIVLGISVLLALLLANSSFSGEYFEFFGQHFGFAFNGETYLDYNLHHWIDDGLMALFFFVVGLELKREFIGGELANPRNTILPIGAAIGGMMVPALIYLALNMGSVTANGWGIPMATDIAFALGVVYLLGKRIPTSVKVFLATLAIVDDLGAVLVIAFFYTSEISLVSLAVGFGFLLLMFTANKLGVKNVMFYFVVGLLGVWTAFLLSGIHATIAAVLAAFTIPADSKINENVYLQRMKKQLTRFKEAEPNDVRTLEEDQVEILLRIRSVRALFNKCCNRCNVRFVTGKAHRYRLFNTLVGQDAVGAVACNAHPASVNRFGLFSRHRFYHVDVCFDSCVYSRYNACASQDRYFFGIDNGWHHRLFVVATRVTGGFISLPS